MPANALDGNSPNDVVYRFCVREGNPLLNQVIDELDDEASKEMRESTRRRAADAIEFAAERMKA